MALTQQDKEEMLQFLITRGKSLGSLDEADSNLSNKYLAPVLEYSGGTASKAVRLAVSLLKGESAVLRKSGDLVQWQLQGASTWETLYSMADYRGLPGANGTNGKNPVFRKNAANLEYKLDGEEDTAYKLLVALADITGPEGDHIVLRVQDGKLEYKQSKAADSTYQQLLAIEDLRGPQGRPGKDFLILGYYDTIAALRAAVTSPEPGDAYGIGTAAPYPIYIWDAVSQDWVNNGAIQGPAGRSGKSARVNTTTGFWEQFDDDTQTWKQTEAIAVYPVATAEHDGLMSKDDKAKLDQMKGGDVEVSKANVEKVLTGNILTHTHDTERIVTGMPTDVWDGVTVSTALAGSGTVDDPYLIQSCADYIHFYRNAKLYGHDIDINAEPTQDQLSNPKQIKFISNLDFNNIAINLGDAVPIWGDDFIVGALSICIVDGHECNMYNVNFIGTWSVIPPSLYTAVKNLHVIKGLFTVSLTDIVDKGYSSRDFSHDGKPLTPWGILFMASEVENVSFTAEVKFTGDIEVEILFISGAFVMEEIGVIPGFLGQKSYSYSDVIFSVDTNMTKLVTLYYVPSAAIYAESVPFPIVHFDRTEAYKEGDQEPTVGINVTLYPLFNGGKSYTLYVNTDNATPFYDYGHDDTPSFHIGKTTAEMKSPEFLALLNGDTETFVADTENINDGYPIFKPNQTVQTYDGYVKESVFEAFKNNMPTGGSGNVYNLDIDISGVISGLTAEQQTRNFGRTYVAPTNDNIIELLGGIDGIRDLYNKLSPSNNIVVTVPFMTYIVPTRLVSSNVMVLAASNNEYLVALTDGCSVSFGFMFFYEMNDKLNIASVAINIMNFNTATQSATYTYSSEEQNSAQSTDVLDILTSTNTTAALSANQGRVLKGLIDNINSTTVVNSLTSTSTTSALSAAKGKELKTLVDGKVASTEITTIKKLTQSAYDALSSKDSKTLYIIA